MTNENKQDVIQAKINAVVEKYQPEIEDIQKDGAQLGEDAKTSFKFDITVHWGEQEVAFDIPEFKMGTQEFSLDLPQITVRTQDFIFSTPSVRMVTKKIGQYPEFHGFKIVWKDILVDVPEVFMEEQRIAIGIPEFTMATSKFVLDVPEVSMNRATWHLRIPEVRLGDVSFGIPISTNDMKQRGEDLKQRGESVGSQMKAEIESTIATSQAEFNTGTTQDYGENLKQNGTQINQILSVFDSALSQIEAALIQGDKLPTEVRERLNQNKIELTQKRAQVFDQLSHSLQTQADAAQSTLLASLPAAMFA